MATNRQVGTLWCFDVLDRLGDYVDGELPAAERTQVEVHLAGCDACTQFGGEYGLVVSAVRERLKAEGDVPTDVAGRLDAALAKRVR